MSKDLPSLDHVYCINLESSTDRKEHMKKQFQKHQLKATFVSAVHTKTKEYVNHLKNPSKVDNGINRRCFCINDCHHKKRKLRPTEIAISLSHYHVYRKMIRNDDYWALVCEDDVIFVKDFVKVVNRCIPLEIWEEDQPHIIMCGGVIDNFGLKKTEISQFKLSPMEAGCYSNYCYFINFYAAQVLLKHFFPIKKPEDSYKRYLINRNLITCHRIKPSAVGELSAGRNMPAKYQRLSQNKAPPTGSDLRPKETDKGKNRRVFSNKNFDVAVEMKPRNKPNQKPIKKSDKKPEPKKPEIKKAAKPKKLSNPSHDTKIKPIKSVIVKLDKNGTVSIENPEKKKKLSLNGDIRKEPKPAPVEEQPWRIQKPGKLSLTEKIKDNNTMNLVVLQRKVKTVHTSKEIPNKKKNKLKANKAKAKAKAKAKKAKK